MSPELTYLYNLRERLDGMLGETEARIARLEAAANIPGNYEPNYRIALRPDARDDDPMGHDTLLDDIVVRNVPMFRAEQMDRNAWWVACYMNDRGTDRICWDVRARSKPLRIEWTTTEYPEDAVYEHEENPA